MARPRPTTQAAWTREGKEGIVDLVREKLVAPWAEVESRIAHGPWKDFHQVQPLQLNGARQALREEDPPRVVEEMSGHADHPAVTLRVPFDGNKRTIERLRGAKRKLFRRYLSWTNNQQLCGRHAERVVLESMQAAQSKAGLWVPDQPIGEVAEVDGIQIQPGPLDALAYVLDSNPVAQKAALLVEVKNLRGWLYPWAPEVWQLLVKAASVAGQTKTVALLAAPHVSWGTIQLAKDLGFAVVRYGNQLFSPSIDKPSFDQVVDEFGLTIVQHVGPIGGVVGFLEKFLRSGPADWDPEEDRDWCDQQAERLALTSATILEYSDLAGDLPGDYRRVLFQDFKAKLEEVSDWSLLGGY